MSEKNKEKEVNVTETGENTNKGLEGMSKFIKDGLKS